MAGFDRSKFKTTSSQALEKQQKDLAEKRPQRGGNNFADYHEIEDGVNRFRIMPFHPDGGGESYAEAKCTSWLQVNRPKRGEDGKVIEGQFELKQFPLFNAKVHGGCSNDPVEAYMEFAKKVAIPNFAGDDEDKIKLAWSNIVGYRDAKGYHPGIKPNDSWVCYAMKQQKDGSWKLGLLEFKKSVKERLTEIALEVTNGESPDPFTGVEDGYVIKIEKKGAGLDTKYLVSIDSKMIDRVNSQLHVMPLTDEQLEEFSKLPSLYKKFVNSYKRSDFDMQIEGLKRFDEGLTAKKLPIEVFALDEFLDEIEKISNEIKEPSEEAKSDASTDDTEIPFEVDEKPKAQVSKSTAKVVEEKKEEPKPQTSSSTKDRLAEIRAKHAKK